jgi:hypothetical protein
VPSELRSVAARAICRSWITRRAAEGLERPPKTLRLTSTLSRDLDVARRRRLRPHRRPCTSTFRCSGACLVASLLAGPGALRLASRTPRRGPLVADPRRGALVADPSSRTPRRGPLVADPSSRSLVVGSSSPGPRRRSSSPVLIAAGDHERRRALAMFSPVHSERAACVFTARVCTCSRCSSRTYERADAKRSTPPRDDFRVP